MTVLCYVTVVEKPSDTIYELQLSEYALACEAGTSETHEYTKGSISTINFIEVPGFDDGGSRYYLYCPGTKKNEIDEKALSVLPDYYLEEKFEGDELSAYILYGNIKVANGEKIGRKTLPIFKRGNG